MVVERSPLRKLPNISLDLLPFYQVARVENVQLKRNCFHDADVTLTLLMSGQS